MPTVCTGRGVSFLTGKTWYKPLEPSAMYSKASLYWLHQLHSPHLGREFSRFLQIVSTEPSPAEVVPHALHVCPKEGTFIYHCSQVGLQVDIFPQQGIQLIPVMEQASTMPPSPCIIVLGHFLLIHNQVGVRTTLFFSSQCLMHFYLSEQVPLATASRLSLAMWVKLKAL